MIDGNRIPEQGPGDDGYDAEGYDESQRAEILEATRGGPGDGAVLTDLDPDLGGDAEGDDPEPLDTLEMIDGELGRVDGDSALDPDDQDEDEVQADLDDGDDADADPDADPDGDLNDADDAALRP